MSKFSKMIQHLRSKVILIL